MTIRYLLAINRKIDQLIGPSRLVGIALATGLMIVACSQGDSPSLAVSRRIAPLAMVQVAQEPHKANTLSREHSITIDVPESELEMHFGRIADRCTTDAAHHCTILQSDLSSGHYPSGQIKLRIDPAGVDELASFVAGQGHLEHRSTRVEDLAEAMQDTQTRITMLTNYRKQLLELQAKAATNIDAAVKIASELSTVQGDLERATGESAFQTKRTTTDIVNIAFDVAEHKAFWRPIHEAVRNFFGNLSNGTSQAITAIAYIVPWLIVVVPGLYLLRFLWRRRGK